MSETPHVQVTDCSLTCMSKHSNGTVKPVAVETNKYSASIEDTRITPPELLTQPAHQIIRWDSPLLIN